MAKSRDLKVNIVGDADKLDKEAKRASSSLDKLGKQTKLTSTISSKGFAAMKVGATGAAAGLAGLAIAGKQVVEAAIESEKSQAKLRAQLKASGISYKEHAKEIDNVIQKHSQLAGLDDEDLQDAFTNIVRSTGDVNVAMKDMALVSDLARSKNMDVAKAGELVAKVHAGNVGVLKRMGIEFTKTTVNVDRLKETNKKATTEQIAAAKAADQQANAQRALGILQERVRGQAEAYGRTTAGSVDRANVAFENLKETIGEALAPTVERVATRVADFVNEMQAGTGEGGRFVDTLKEMWDAIRPIIVGFGRAARAVGNFTAEHPGLAKLAGSVIAVGLAVKALRFVSAVTGFSTLLKGGRAAAAGLRRIFARGGTAAGEAAAANAAGGLSAKAGVIRNNASKIGRSAGRAFGAAFRVGAIVGLADIGVAVTRTVKDQLTKAGLWNPPGGRGSFWDNLIPTNLLPKVKKGEGLLGRLLGRQVGGMVPGTGRGDVVPAMLEPGEFVIRKQVVDKYGPTYFANLNGTMGAPQGNRRVPGYTSGGIIARANKMDAMDLPYKWGGGHGGGIAGGVDCSGAVSWALGVSPRVSGQFMSFGRPGPGSPNDTKVYANPEHVFAVFNGKGWGTSRENPGGGPGWLSYNHRPGFTIRHLNDSGAGGSVGGASRGDKQEAAERRKERRIAREERAGSRAINRIASVGLRGTSGLAKRAGSLGAGVERAETTFGQTERLFGQVIGGRPGAYGDEDLGTASGRKARITELAALKKLKMERLAQMKKRATALRSLVNRYEKTLKTMQRARGKAKGAKRAKMGERIKAYADRLVEYKAELLSLGESIGSTQLDIGDLQKDIQEVAATPDTAVEAPDVPTVGEQAANLLDLVGLRERAGLLTPEAANAQRAEIIRAAIQGRFGATTEREQLQLMGDLRELEQAQTEAVVDNTSALKELNDSIQAQLAFANGVAAVTSMEAIRAMGDVISGQLGTRTGRRGYMPGSGALARL